MLTVAQRVGCDWKTAERYIKDNKTLTKMFEAEKQAILDIAESVIFGNIQINAKAQHKHNIPVDSADAKWVLSKLGKDRGYVERQEVTGPDGEEIPVRLVEVIRDDASK